MNYLQVLEVLSKLEKDTKIIQIQEKLVEFKRNIQKYKIDTTTK